ncbi:MAG: imidazolonepropionase [Myxococcota bacterium]
MWDLLLLDGHAATLRDHAVDPWGTLREAAIGIQAGRIAWVGPRSELEGPAEEIAIECRSLAGAWVTPGLVDCHTHLVFAGNRADEFEDRLHGDSYADIAARGGGIQATVAATRAASEEALLASARTRCRALMAEGATTIEVKSGYGLTVTDELRMLRVARKLETLEPVRIVTTLLGAHACPAEFRSDPEAYVDLVCRDMIPQARAQGLADAVDAFCEDIGFSPSQVERVLEAATKAGLHTKLHAEQLSDQGGAALAARFGALSADHLEWLSDEGIAAMAEAGTVAVLLPGAFYALRETRQPPVKALRAAGIPMALASDCNPGSSPTTALQLMMSFGCTFFGLTPAEALAGLTREGARALGRAQDLGSIEVGKCADLAIWNIDHPRDLAYWVGGGRLQGVYFGGRLRGPNEGSK